MGDLNNGESQDQKKDLENYNLSSTSIEKKMSPHQLTQYFKIINNACTTQDNYESKIYLKFC